MTKPIIVGYDPRRADHAPLEFGVAAAELTGAPLLAISAQAPMHATPTAPAGMIAYSAGGVHEDLLPDCTEAIDQIEPELRALDIRVDCLKVRSTSAARALHDAAEREEAGLLVVGSSRRSTAGRVLAGSTAERLLHGAPCPVAAVPLNWTRRGGLNTIGVAFVDSEEGREALRSAHALARRTKAKLRAVTVARISPAMYAEIETYVAGQSGKDREDVEGEHRLQAEKELRSAVAELGDEVEVEIDAVVGDPAETLVDLSQHIDLLVCGSRGYGPVRGVLLGSVSRRIVREAHCPVMVLPRGVKASLEELLSEAPGAAAPA
jgi:nucleotide-binding universal stress UspA family protein